MNSTLSPEHPPDVRSGNVGIGVFDSGVGGLSVLRAIHRRLPAAPTMYVGDVAHAPYGERHVAEVLDRCHLIVEHFAHRGARLIVVACNTATALAIESLRERWPALTFVGVEPGVKPAAARSRTRRIAVMATPLTAASKRLRELIAAHGAQAHVHVQPCPGLATAIEAGSLQGPALMGVLQPCCDGVRAADVDTVVLGCTHYPFVADEIRQALGSDDIVLIDTASAIAERVASIWPEVPRPALAKVRVLSSGATHVMKRLLQKCPGLEALPVEHLAL